MHFPEYLRCPLLFAIGVSGLAACSAPESANLFEKSRSIDNPIGTGGATSGLGGGAPEPALGTGGTVFGSGGTTPPATGGSNLGSNPGTNTGGVTQGSGGESMTGGEGGESTGGAPASGGSGSSNPSGGASSNTGGGGACVPHPEVCDGLDNNCSVGTEDEQCPLNCTGVALAGRGYMICRNQSADWFQARTRCTDAGMAIVQLESAMENMLVAQAATPPSGGSPAWAWIGASDSETEGTWVWDTGEAFWIGEGPGQAINGRFAAWADGQPNSGGDCVRQFATSAAWTDLDCDDEASVVVCEHR